MHWYPVTPIRHMDRSNKLLKYCNSYSLHSPISEYIYIYICFFKVGTLWHTHLCQAAEEQLNRYHMVDEVERSEYT